MIDRLLNRPCTITRRTPGDSTDSYGNDVPGIATDETVCELQQQQRTEPGGQGEISDSHWLMILPAGTELGTADTVTVDGQAFEVIGEPWPARNPRTGRTSHVEATVRRTGP